MTSPSEGEQPISGDDSQRVLIRLLAALVVKGESTRTAANRLLELGVSPADVAKVLGIAQASVYVIRHRAKKAAQKPGEAPA